MYAAVIYILYFYLWNKLSDKWLCVKWRIFLKNTNRKRRRVHNLI